MPRFGEVLKVLRVMGSSGNGILIAGKPPWDDIIARTNSKCGLRGGRIRKSFPSSTTLHDPLLILGVPVT